MWELSPSLFPTPTTTNFSFHLHQPPFLVAPVSKPKLESLHISRSPPCKTIIIVRDNSSSFPHQLSSILSTRAAGTVLADLYLCVLPWRPYWAAQACPHRNNSAPNEKTRQEALVKSHGSPLSPQPLVLDRTIVNGRYSNTRIY